MLMWVIILRADPKKLIGAIILLIGPIGAIILWADP